MFKYGLRPLQGNFSYRFWSCLKIIRAKCGMQVRKMEHIFREINFMETIFQVE